MLSVVIIVLVLVVAIPVAVMMGTSVIAMVLGWLTKDDVDRRYEGSEYVDLS